MGGKKVKKRYVTIQTSSHSSPPSKLNPSSQPSWRIADTVGPNTPQQLEQQYLQELLKENPSFQFIQTDVKDYLKFITKTLGYPLEQVISLRPGQSPIKTVALKDITGDPRTDLEGLHQAEESKGGWEMSVRNWEKVLEDESIFGLNFDKTREQNLFKCLMLERLRWLKQVPLVQEVAAIQNLQLIKKLLKQYLSREVESHEDGKHFLKSFRDQYMEFLKEGEQGKQVPFGMLSQEAIVYRTVIYSMKKHLRYLHQRLGDVMILQESGHQNLKYFKAYEQNRSFYLNFFNCVIHYFQLCKSKFNEIGKILEAVAKQVDLGKKNFKAGWFEEEPSQLQDFIFRFYRWKKIEHSVNYQSILKNLFVLFILQDPLINKVVVQYKDKIILDLEEAVGYGMSGAMDNEEALLQVLRERFEECIIGEIRMFRLGTRQKGSRKMLIWADWYQYLKMIGLFKVNAQQLDGQLQLHQMKEENVLCEYLEGLSEDSDDDRDSKYNILDDSDEAIDEEENEGSNEENEEEDDENSAQMIRDIAKIQALHLNESPNPKLAHESKKYYTLLDNQKQNKKLEQPWQMKFEDVIDFIQSNNVSLQKGAQAQKKRKKKEKVAGPLQEPLPQTLPSTQGPEELQPSEGEDEPRNEEEEDEDIQQFRLRLESNQSVGVVKKLQPNLSFEWIQDLKNQTMK